MTCIVGMEHEGEVWIGGDSAGIAGAHLMLRDDKKVFSRKIPKEKTGMVFGFENSVRMGQLLQYRLEIPKFTEGTDEFSWMATDFVEAMRLTFMSGGYMPGNGATGFNQPLVSSFLVGFHGKLFLVEDTGQVGRSKFPFYAVGAGRDAALGAMNILVEHPCFQGPHEILTLALKAAQRFSSCVRGPFHIVSSGANQ